MTYRETILTRQTKAVRACGHRTWREFAETDAYSRLCRSVHQRGGNRCVVCGRKSEWVLFTDFSYDILSGEPKAVAAHAFAVCRDCEHRVRHHADGSWRNYPGEIAFELQRLVGLRKLGVKISTPEYASDLFRQRGRRPTKKQRQARAWAVETMREQFFKLCRDMGIGSIAQEAWEAWFSLWENDEDGMTPMARLRAHIHAAPKDLRSAVLDDVGAGKQTPPA